MISFRVDDFPYTKFDETWRHNLTNFKMFNEVMKKYHAQYILGIIPDRLSEEMLKFLADEQYMITPALHGIHHDERFPNEFHSGETEEQIFQTIMSAKYPLEKFCGPIDIYIPPHNVIDTRTVNSLKRAGFKMILGGPGSDNDILHFAMASGLKVLRHDPPLYGRSDEIMQNGGVQLMQNLLHEGDDLNIALHWTWEMNIGLESLDKFLKMFEYEIGVGRRW